VIDFLGPSVLGGMTHESVRVAACRWMRKVVTTEPPRYVPHDEYSWECALVGELPLLGALLLEDGKRLAWCRSGRKSAATALRVVLSFFPYCWNTSDEVQIGLSQHGEREASCIPVAVHDTALKQDPRDLVRFDLADGSVIQTGSLIRIGTVTSQRLISAGLVVVAQADTESCRCSRWRMKRRIAVDLPSALSFLKTGRRGGFLRRHPQSGCSSTHVVGFCQSLEQ
jgi:hypothetical protein